MILKYDQTPSLKKRLLQQHINDSINNNHSLIDILNHLQSFFFVFLKSRSSQFFLNICVFALRLKNSQSDSQYQNPKSSYSTDSAFTLMMGCVNLQPQKLSQSLASPTPTPPKKNHHSPRMPSINIQDVKIEEEEEERQLEEEDHIIQQSCDIKVPGFTVSSLMHDRLQTCLSLQRSSTNQKSLNSYGNKSLRRGSSFANRKLVQEFQDGARFEQEGQSYYFKFQQLSQIWYNSRQEKLAKTIFCFYRYDYKFYQMFGREDNKGEFVNGKTIGKFVFPSGNVYVGEFLNQDIEGHGKMMLENGRVYQGQWKQGRLNGFATIIYEDGNVYEGNVENSLKHGWGTFTWKNGKSFTGNWKQGKIYGRGTLTTPDGPEKKGLWLDGKFMSDRPMCQ